MARQIRIEYPGAYHHVISRGYNKMWIFRDEEDFSRFLDDLEEVFSSHLLIIHSYCQMNNHFHLFTETPNANLQKAMQRLLSRYATYFKRKYQFTGKVFEKRYSAYLVSTEENCLNLQRYIHKNPCGVIVKNPEEWQYSSYNTYINKTTKPRFLEINSILNRFDTDRAKAIIKFQQHFQREDSSYWNPQDYILGKSILGSQKFLLRIKDKIPNGDYEELTGLITLSNIQRVEHIIASIESLNLEQESKESFSIYCLKKFTGLNSKEINSHLNLDIRKSTMSQRARRFHDKLLTNKTYKEQYLKFLELIASNELIPSKFH
jgi:REP element-mobilizing transposase RayT